ncbi:nicotinamide N-methyltransferase-like [Gastrophryne carolinensis]
MVTVWLLPHRRVTAKQKEERLREKVKQVLFCDVSKSNPLAPQELPPADCVTATVCLEGACRSRESYGLALRNLGNLLRQGGHLLMAGDLGANYFEVGPNKIFSLNVSVAFLKEELGKNGFRVIEVNTTGKSEEAANSDYEGNYFVHVQKV